MSETNPLDQYPIMAIAQLRDRYSYSRSLSDETELMEVIKSNKMKPFYQNLCEIFDWQIDNDLTSELTNSNNKELDSLQDALSKAKEAKGEEDVRVAIQNLALFYLRIGDYQESKKQLGELFQHTVALGQKIDDVFSQMRLAFFNNEYVTFNE